MPGGLMGATAALATAASVVATSLGAPPRHPRPVPSIFGGPAAVHVPQVGRIETDLEPATSLGLRQVSCAGVSNRTTACFVAR
jgi:hypothetical protein